MATHTTQLPETLPKSFAELCKIHWPRPIHDAADYHNASEVVDRLALLARRTKDQEDYLESLSILIEKYDRDKITTPEATGASALETLKYLMEGHDWVASDLGRLLGSRTLGPAILRGDRKISRANAQKLGEHFKVSPGLFFQI
jgi:antitoxin component HigA of HigAB toxin-antitoxin module